MIETPQIAAAAAQAAAVIRIRIARARIARVMGPGIEELKSTLAARGIAPAGPLFAHHLNTGDEDFDFEPGVPSHRPATCPAIAR